ncbi:MAG: Bug family tripartite tricarboxylate transporter substrate binding protein [Beijerinckiaceae bacterium]
MRKTDTHAPGRILAGLLAAAVFPVAATGAFAQSGSAPFYQGKKIRFMVGTAAGGGFSNYALLLATHMPRHIPGTPNMVVEHMPGAGGINSLNFVASAGAKDGTVMAIMMPNFYVTPFTEPKAVRFDPAKFRFVGRMGDFGRVLVTWHSTGVRSVDDLKKKEVIVGASSRRSTTYTGPEAMNQLLGTKMKMVTGYRGTGPTLIALEKGEVGATTVAWSTLTGLRPQWLAEKKVHVIAGMDRIPVPIKGVPSARDLIKDPAKQAIMDFIGLAAEFGTAVGVAPGVPAERTAILRAAFDATMKDKAFLAEAKKRDMPINPMSGAALDKMFAESGNPSKETIAVVSRMMGIGAK